MRWLRRLLFRRTEGATFTRILRDDEGRIIGTDTARAEVGADPRWRRR